MNTFSLNIAGIKICFRRAPGSPDFVPSGNLKEFISSSQEGGITVTVFNSNPPEFTSESEVLSAPFMEEEKDGTFVKRSEKFWSVHRAVGMKIIRIYNPETDKVASNLLLPSGSAEWELYSSNEVICANPFSYPLDGLILYYALQAQKLLVAGCWLAGSAILIHASAVEYEGRGYLFTGVSGKGKTTMSDLWKEAGATVIHDDLIVLTHAADGSVIASGTPLNGNTYARQTRLDAIFLIEHAAENSIEPVKGVEAFSSVMSNTIQHNYDKQIIENHLENLTKILAAVPVYRMRFRPDKDIVKETVALIGHKAFLP